MSEHGLATHVLAADEVFRDVNGVMSRVNHRVRGGINPGFQNILFGDGHVEGVRGSVYSTPLSTTNFSVQHYAGGPYFYWQW